MGERKTPLHGNPPKIMLSICKFCICKFVLNVLIFSWEREREGERETDRETGRQKNEVMCETCTYAKEELYQRTLFSIQCSNPLASKFIVRLYWYNNWLRAMHKFWNIFWKMIQNDEFTKAEKLKSLSLSDNWFFNNIVLFLVIHKNQHKLTNQHKLRILQHPLHVPPTLIITVEVIFN